MLVELRVELKGSKDDYQQYLEDKLNHFDNIMNMIQSKSGKNIICFCHLQKINKFNDQGIQLNSLIDQQGYSIMINISQAVEQQTLLNCQKQFPIEKCFVAQYIELKLMIIVKYLLLVIFSITVQCKLEQVASMFRHGARYHLNTYYDGNSTRQLWGELSPVGMRQHETLGKLLRKDYIQTLKFLSDEYTDRSIEVFSTNYNRTILSVRSQLYGLYPLGFGAKKLNVPKQYNIPPFSMSQDASDNTFSLPQGHLPFIVNINDSVVMTSCQNWDKLVQSNIDRQKVTYDQMNLTYFPFLRRMGQMFNLPETSINFYEIGQLYDTLTVDRYLGRPLPSDFSEDDYQNMRHLRYWLDYFKINFDLSKAINTPKLRRVISDFDGRINNPNQQLKWTFLSVHDTDIAGMLQDLNGSSAQCIEQLYRYGKTSVLNCDPGQEYVSNIIFELHSQSNQYYIRIRHDGVYLNLCEKKNTSCPYEEWKSRVKTIILDDTDKVCKAKMQIKDL